MKWLFWARNILGNSPKTVMFIGLFVLILCTLFWRCSKAAEVDLRAGSSFAHGTGPVLGLQLYFPLENRLDIFAGTLLYGATATDPNNWSWEVGVRTCRWRLCASLGGSYLQRIDSTNGTRTNYNLELSYLLNWHRVSSIDVSHVSNGGTGAPNLGRNCALVSIRLQ